jgi:tetratricopeptide (TPR) repeat protein
MRGFGEAASGRWEEAVPLMERFVKYNPGPAWGQLTLALVYAQVGRVQEARAIFDKITEKWPNTMKNVRWWISNWPLKDLQVTQRFAEGWIKAGFQGEPTGFYKISADNRLTGEELRKLFIGKKVSGSNMITAKQWSIERSQNGKAVIHDGEKSDTGKSWIEEDMLCNQWDNLLESLTDCWVIYRNPEGTPENNDEYLGAPGYGIYPFSVVQ